MDSRGAEQGEAELDPVAGSALANIGFHKPAAALEGLVSTYYWLEAGPAPVEELLHPEWTNVRFGLRGEWFWQQVRGTALRPAEASIFGPSDRGARVRCSANALVLGYGLLPLGFARLVGGSASRLANGVMSMNDLWGEGQERLLQDLRAAADPGEWAALLDAELLARLERAPPPPRLLIEAHRLLASGMIDTVESFAGQLGVSERTLERLCGPWLGFGPKTLLRRQRLLRVLDALVQLPPGEPIGSLLSLDFADQSHFVREFHAFMGMSPTAYLAMPRVVMRRAMMQRTAMLGHSMQVLHTPPPR